MNRHGVLLDTGPLVALLSKNDERHDEAKRQFASCQSPFRCCEAVLAEACFLMRKVDVNAPAEILALGRKGLFEIALCISDNLAELEELLRKYKKRPISLADASLIRCAEIFTESRILTFDSDFSVYRWGRNKSFQLL